MRLTRTRMARRCADSIDSANHVLGKFTADFAADPLHALSWSTDTFKAAAARQAYAQVQAHRTREPGEWGPLKLSSLKAYALERAMRVAKYPPQSTSPVGNLAEQYTAAAWAELYESLIQNAPEHDEEFAPEPAAVVTAPTPAGVTLSSPELSAHPTAQANAASWPKAKRSAK